MVRTTPLPYQHIRSSAVNGRPARRAAVRIASAHLDGMRPSDRIFQQLTVDRSHPIAAARAVALPNARMAFSAGVCAAFLCVISMSVWIVLLSIQKIVALCKYAVL